MAANVNRWMKYAKARLEAALGQGNEELDRLEAEREAELADKPWLRGDGDAPSFEEARARIEWEAERQRQLAEERDGSGAPDTNGDSKQPTDAPSTDLPSGGQSTGEAPDSPGEATQTGRGSAGSDRLEDNAEAAARESARLELEERQRKSAERLDEIRQELGIDPAAGDDTPG